MREAVILTNLGESNYRRDKPQQAIAVLSEAERISATLGDRILEAEILRGLAKAHTLLQDLDAARDYISRSVALFEQARSKPFLGLALRTLAEVEAAGVWGGEGHRKAEEAYRKSLEIFEELGNEVEIANTCQSFAAFLDLTAQGDAARASEAAALRDRALEIHGKQLASETYALPALDGDATDPGIKAP
jgi:tetratricopeptide (TPR) repeat protein